MDPASIGEVVTTVGGMATTTKAILEAIKSARAKSKSPEVEKSLSEALEQIFSLQASMIDLQTKVLALQKENSQLAKKIREEEERSLDRENYERRHVGQTVVVVRKSEPNTYLCATCFEAGEKTYLTPLPGIMRGIVGTHMCPKHQLPLKLS